MTTTTGLFASAGIFLVGLILSHPFLGKERSEIKVSQCSRGKGYRLKRSSVTASRKIPAEAMRAARQYFPSKQFEEEEKKRWFFCCDLPPSL